MNPIAHVLLVSRDQMLLQTRKLILGAYFDVEAAGRVSEAEALIAKHSFDLVVLCYTLTEVEGSRIAELARKRWPRALFVSLTAGGRGCAPWSAKRLTSEEGPLALLRGCAEILGFCMKSKGRMVPIGPTIPRLRPV